MRKLSINTQEDLIQFKKTFSNEYKSFFSQDLKDSKVEAFISKLAGVKNFNVLLNSLPTSDYFCWEDIESALYNGEYPDSYKKDLLFKYFPKNIEISMCEHFDGYTFNINRINMINNYEIPDHEDVKELKKHVNNLSYFSDFKGSMKEFFETDEFELFDEEWTKSIQYLYNFFKKLNLGNKETFLFVLDFCIFCNEGLIPDTLAYKMEDYLDANIEHS